MHDTILNRHCKRAFLGKEVPKEIINTILDNAGNAASSKNSQPWQVCILTGHTKQALADEMCNKFDQSIFEKPNYIFITEQYQELNTIHTKHLRI